MAQISGNEKSLSRYFSDSLQLINWILDSGKTCHMTPQASYFIPGSWEDTDKYIEVADVDQITEKQKEQFQITMFDNNKDTLSRHLTAYFCHQIYAVGYFLLSCKWIRDIIVYFTRGFKLFTLGDKEKNMVTLPHSAQWKHAFWGKWSKWQNQRK